MQRHCIAEKKLSGTLGAEDPVCPEIGRQGNINVITAQSANAT
jgi:hypothetical protein